jgi:hypothetical protein
LTDYQKIEVAEPLEGLYAEKARIKQLATLNQGNKSPIISNDKNVEPVHVSSPSSSSDSLMMVAGAVETMYLEIGVKEYAGLPLLKEEARLIIPILFSISISPCRSLSF